MKIDSIAYPLEIPWDGILVDDAGDERDIVLRLRKVISIIHGTQAETQERELCESLGVSDIRDFIRKPNSFFASHFHCYSKGGRKAPIYWPLSTSSGSFTVWIYYPRLTDATLYAVHDIARKKAELLALELAEISGLKAKSTKEQQRFDLLTRDVGEVRQFAEDLLKVANLPYKPDLDDGVPICAAPLHAFFRHQGWSKYLKETWEELETGDYDWAHLAYAIWPGRVREKAKTDRSLVIAHGLESHP